VIVVVVGRFVLRAGSVSLRIDLGKSLYIPYTEQGASSVNKGTRWLGNENKSFAVKPEQENEAVQQPKTVIDM